MKRVALVTTGKCEHRALPLALGRLFPDTEFLPVPPDQPLNGFTSWNVTTPSDKNAPTVDTSSVRELVATLVGAVIPGGLDEPFDFAFLLDDLELCNGSHPDLVVGVVRQAVRLHVERSKWNLQKRERVVATVREKCSFHLFRPMIEAYFFGDPDALTRAKIQRQPQLDATRDFEQLLITDPDYLAVPDENDKLSPHRGGAGDRSRHPKSYMTYLCAPSLTKKRPYQEVREGVAALEQLNWRCVIQAAVLNCPFLSAMLEDMAWALKQPLDWITPAQTAELTRLKSDPNGVLRNI